MNKVHFASHSNTAVVKTIKNVIINYVECFRYGLLNAVISLNISLESKHGDVKRFI